MPALRERLGRGRDPSAGCTLTRQRRLVDSYLEDAAMATSTLNGNPRGNRITKTELVGDPVANAEFNFPALLVAIGCGVRKFGRRR